MATKERKPRAPNSDLDHADFMRIWKETHEEGGSISDIEEVTGLTHSQCVSRAYMLRKRGVELPNFRSGGRKVNWDEVREAASELGLEVSDEDRIEAEREEKRGEPRTARPKAKKAAAKKAPAKKKAAKRKAAPAAAESAPALQ